MGLSSIHSSSIVESSSASITPPGCCCGCSPCTYAVGILNSNAITDDNFSLTLNGSFVGNAIETLPVCPGFGPYRGTLFYSPTCAGTSFEIDVLGGFLGAYSLVYVTSSLMELTCE